MTAVFISTNALLTAVHHASAFTPTADNAVPTAAI